ncbi:MAG: SulP family inorganic anion transporter, partial [Candidatus Puniceispirillum sp.]
MTLTKFLPILRWGRTYSAALAAEDALAALIVTIMLIPQSLAYALLAGLPPEMGLYASILPLVAYAIFGTSNALAVGPVAVISLMTAAAIGKLGLSDPAQIIAAAGILAALSGLMLLLLGALRLGFLANFLSHPVVSGFITASGLIIALSQVKHLFGVEASGHDLITLVRSLLGQIDQINGPTTIIGLVAAGFLAWTRKGLGPLFRRFRFAPTTASMLAKTGPVMVIVTTIVAVKYLGLDAKGVAIVGAVPQGLPVFGLPDLTSSLWFDLAASAALISIIGFVESVSVGQTLAAKKRT